MAVSVRRQDRDRLRERFPAPIIPGAASRIRKEMCIRDRSLALLCGGIPVISDFDSTPQIEIKKEITKMAINFGAEYRRFNKEMEKKHRLYAQLEMTQEQIDALDAFDKEEFLSNNNYCRLYTSDGRHHR